MGSQCYLLGHQAGRGMLSLRRTRGFTLIEVIIIIALIGLLLVAGLPAFTTMLSNLRVRSVSDGVLSGLQFARTEALKRNLNVTFRLDPLTGVGGGWQVLLPDLTVIQSKSAAEGGAVLVELAAGTEIVFNNLGQRLIPDVTTPVLNVNMSNPGVANCETAGGSVRCLRVTVSIGGATRLCDPRRTAPDPQAC